MSLKARFYIKKDIMFIKMIGEMDQENVGSLRDKLVKIINDKNIKHLVFNLKELTFMDSTGVGIIIGRYNQLKSKNGKVILCDINKNIQKIILLSGLSRICIFKENEEESYKFLEDELWITN